MNQIPPNPPTSFQFACNWTASTISDWLEEIGPVCALEILALWARFRRFPENDQHPARDQINHLVVQDTQRLLHHFSQLQPTQEVNDWLFWAKNLSEAVDWTTEANDLDELAGNCWQVFDQLDKYSLAVYAFGKLSPAGHGFSMKLAEWHKGIKDAENFVRDEVETFFAYSCLISRDLTACRNDLDSFDQELFATILKHGVVKDAINEARSGNPVIFTQQEKEGIEMLMKIKWSTE